MARLVPFKWAIGFAALECDWISFRCVIQWAFSIVLPLAATRTQAGCKLDHPTLTRLSALAGAGSLACRLGDCVPSSSTRVQLLFATESQNIDHSKGRSEPSVSSARMRRMQSEPEIGSLGLANFRHSTSASNIQYFERGMQIVGSSRLAPKQSV